MYSFYKIENGLPIVGSGTFVPEDFIEYTIGSEPKELLKAIKKEQKEQLNIENTIKNKKIKEDSLDNIKVTTSNGNCFDGNLNARNNIISAILSSEILNKTEVQWKLADNTIKNINISELKEALSLATNEVEKIVIGEK